MTGWILDVTTTVDVLQCLYVIDDGIDVVVESGSERSSDYPNLVNDGVVCLVNHDVPSLAAGTCR